MRRCLILSHPVLLRGGFERSNLRHDFKKNLVCHEFTSHNLILKLCYTCMFQLPVLELLVENGADLEAVTKAGETPLGESPHHPACCLVAPPCEHSCNLACWFRPGVLRLGTCMGDMVHERFSRGTWRFAQSAVISLFCGVHEGKNYVPLMSSLTKHFSTRGGGRGRYLV